MNNSLAIHLGDLRPVGNEPRIRDVRIGERLGMAQPLNIRGLKKPFWWRCFKRQAEGFDMTVAKFPDSVRFQDTDLSIIDHNGAPWVASADLARALGYAHADKVTHIYNRRKDEFSAEMSQTLKLSVVRKTGAVAMDNRIFSPRGCHLIAMFARTERAKAFRKWVLDVLEGIDRSPSRTNPMTLSAAQRSDTQSLICALWPSVEERRDAYKRLKDSFDVALYKDLPHADFAEAKSFIESECAPRTLTLSLPIKDPDARLLETNAEQIAAALHYTMGCLRRVETMSKRLRAVSQELQDVRNVTAEIYSRLEYAEVYARPFLDKSGRRQ